MQTPSGRPERPLTIEFLRLVLSQNLISKFPQILPAGSNFIGRVQVVEAGVEKVSGWRGRRRTRAGIAPVVTTAEGKIPVTLVSPPLVGNGRTGSGAPPISACSAPFRRRVTSEQGGGVGGRWRHVIGAYQVCHRVLIH